MKSRALITIGFVASFLVGSVMSFAFNAVADETLDNDEIRTREITDARSGFLYGVSIGTAMGTHINNEFYKQLSSERRDEVISWWSKENVCSTITIALDTFRAEEAPMFFTNEASKECVATFISETLQDLQVDCESESESWGLK